jgi:drug/metabolite transporter (DMT)-like permease
MRQAGRPTWVVRKKVWRDWRTTLFSGQVAANRNSPRTPTSMRSSTSATLLGTGAILLWSSLASLTVLKGAVPPLQTTAIAFAIGGLVLVAAAVLRGRLTYLWPTRASLALGLYGLFCYHALYFAALSLAPAAEASLITSLWALFTVVFSGLLPGQPLRLHHLVAALIGLAAATLLVWNSLGVGAPGSHRAFGFTLAFGCALIWSSYSVASRLFAAVPSDSIAVPCLITAGLAGILSLTFETWVAPGNLSWLALIGLGVGPVGAAFLLWDVGMKGGDVSLLGALSYAAPVLSTLLLVLLRLAEPSLQLGLACALMVLATAIAARA